MNLGDVPINQPLDSSAINQTSQIPTGAIMPYAGNSAPSGWVLCDGNEYPRTGIYQNLFSLVGVTWGSPSTGSVFKVPDLRQRFPMGKGSSGVGSVIGETGGTLNHTHSLTGTTLPSHSHDMANHSHTITHFHDISHVHQTPSHTHGFSGTTNVQPQGQGAGVPFGSGFQAAAGNDNLTAFGHYHGFAGNTDGNISGITGGASPQQSGPSSSTYSGTPSTNSTGGPASSPAIGGSLGTANPPYATVQYIIKL